MTSRRVSGWWWPPIAAAFVWSAPWPPSVIDAMYSRGIYRWIQSFLTTLSNLTPWTWFDVIVGVVVGLALRRVVVLARGWRADGALAAIGEGIKRGARAAGAIALAFLLLWGFNYRRTPLADALGGGPAPTTDDLKALAADAASLAARTRPIARKQLLSYEQVAAVLPPAFNDALLRVGRPRLTVPGRPKYTLFTPFFTRAGVTGMVDPFMLESLVHPDLLPFERPFVLAHEWAHLAGFADEAEASAIGWSACMRGDAALVNSAAMFLVEEAGAALPAPVWRELVAGMDPGVVDDLRALAERLRLIQPQVREASFKVYDQYLKANRVEDGVRSYSRVLQLLVLPAFREQLNGLRFDPADPTRPR